MSNVDDHGLEVLKKAAEFVVPNVKNDYYLKVGLFGKLASPSSADTVTALYPSSTVEVYQYRVGGLTGSIIKTITVTYVDSTKELILSVVST
jgi:hypothetical protein